MAELGPVGGIKVFQEQRTVDDSGASIITEVEHLVAAARPGSGFIAKIEADGETPEAQAASLDKATRELIAKIEADPQGLDWMVARSGNALYVLGGVLDETWNPSLTKTGALGVPNANGQEERARLVYVKHDWQKEDWEDLREGLANTVRGLVMGYAVYSIGAGLSGNMYGAEVSSRVFGTVLPGTFVANMVEAAPAKTPAGQDTIASSAEKRARDLVGDGYKISARGLPPLKIRDPRS